MMVLDVMIVSVALPSLQHELRLSPGGLEWVVSAYALALAALIPTGGALGDYFGRRRIFMSGTALFALASVGCALSVSGGMLIGFRVVQGIGGAVMSSLTLSLIAEAYPPKARTGPIGLWLRSVVWPSRPADARRCECGRGGLGSFPSFGLPGLVPFISGLRYVVPAGQMDLGGVVAWPEPACSCPACCCQARCAVTVTSLRRECGSASGPDGPALRGQRHPELADAVSA